MRLTFFLNSRFEGKFVFTAIRRRRTLKALRHFVVGCSICRESSCLKKDDYYPRGVCKMDQGLLHLKKIASSRKMSLRMQMETSRGDWQKSWRIRKMGGVALEVVVEYMSKVFRGTRHATEDDVLCARSLAILLGTQATACWENLY